jgi:hypothetical protein
MGRYGMWGGVMLAGVLATMPAIACAETPRELLLDAVFTTRDKPTALSRIDHVSQATNAILARSSDNEEAAIVQATAAGYRAKLTGNRSGAVAARKQFEMLIAKYPRNPEAHIALGAWHIGVIASFGQFVGRAAVGAQKRIGMESIERAVALGNNRAMFLGLGALLRLELDPSDPRGRQLAEAAGRGSAPTALDRIMQRSAAAVLVPLRKGDRKATQALADRLLPLGQFARK